VAARRRSPIDLSKHDVERAEDGGNVGQQVALADEVHRLQMREARRGTARLSGTKHEALSIVGAAAGGEDVPVLALDNLLDDGKVSATDKFVIKLDVEGVEIEAVKGATRLLQCDSVIMCEEHGNDPQHTVSRFILDQTPLQLIVYDPRSNRYETITELSILDRIKVSSHVGYNVFGTSSAFWQDRFHRLNASAVRRAQ
jgi:hypothetical protein